MSIELFVNQINLMKSFNSRIEQLHDLTYINLVESPLFDIPAQMFDNFIYTICTDEGTDLVFWWMYEDVDKIIYEDEKEIHLDTVYQLYEYLTEHNLFNI